MRTLSLLLAVTLVACSSAARSGADGDTDVDLAVQPAAVSAGDSVTLTLHNESDVTVGYNLCTSALERQSGADWQPVPSNRVCTMELRTLAPETRAQYELDLPAGLAPGSYRYRTTVEDMSSGTRDSVTSGSFTVR